MASESVECRAVPLSGRRQRSAQLSPSSASVPLIVGLIDQMIFKDVDSTRVYCEVRGVLAQDDDDTAPPIEFKAYVFLLSSYFISVLY